MARFRRYLWGFLFCLLLTGAAAAEPVTWVYVADFQGDRVIRVDPASGSFELVFNLNPDDRPRGVAVGPDGGVYVALRGGSQNIKRYDPVTGALSNFTASIGGFGPGLIDFDSNGDLIVGGDVSGGSSVFRYDGATGTLIDSFAFAGNGNVVGLEVHDGFAYSAALFSGNVARFDLGQSPPTGSQLIDGSQNPVPIRHQALGMTIGHTGNLFVANTDLSIREFDLQTGALVGTFVDQGATDIFFDATSSSYFLTAGNRLLQYDTSGAQIGSFSDPLLSHGYGIDIVTIPVPSAACLALPVFGWVVGHRRTQRRRW